MDTRPALTVRTTVVSLVSDSRFNDERWRWWVSTRSLERDQVRFVAEREDSDNTCIEFYDHEKPSPTGILLWPGAYWQIERNDCIARAPIHLVRYAAFLQHEQQRTRQFWQRFGDNNRFVGVLMPVSKFARLRTLEWTEEKRAYADRLLARFLRELPPAPNGELFP